MASFWSIMVEHKPPKPLLVLWCPRRKYSRHNFFLVCGRIKRGFITRHYFDRNHYTVFEHELQNFTTHHFQTLMKPAAAACLFMFTDSLIHFWRPTYASSSLSFLMSWSKSLPIPLSSSRRHEWEIPDSRENGKHLQAGNAQSWCQIASLLKKAGL